MENWTPQDWVAVIGALSALIVAIITSLKQGEMKREFEELQAKIASKGVLHGQGK